MFGNLESFEITDKIYHIPRISFAEEIFRYFQMRGSDVLCHDIYLLGERGIPELATQP